MGKVNRAKTIAAAHKYLAKGNLKRAVREYERVLKDDPSDIRTKLKVADLLFRLGDKDRATATFEEVARFYGTQGFLLKAVAVYKQVQKLKPDDVDVHLALAGLYQQIGLISDAIAQYRQAIAIQEGAGLALDRLKTAQKMLELDPDNARLHVMLGEDFSREGMIEEAVHEFRAAMEILHRQELTEEFVSVAERLLYHQPDDYETSKVLAAHFIAKRDGLRALTRLQVCYKAKPNDPEVLDLLAAVFEFLGQPQKAVAVLKSLAHEYDRTGLIRDRDEVFQRVLKLTPGDREANEALQYAPPIEVQTGSEIEFESTPPAGEEILVADDEEIGIDELEEDTHPEPGSGEIEVSLDDLDLPPDAIPRKGAGAEAERTLATGMPSFDHEPVPIEVREVSSPIAIDLNLVPPEFQDDIQNLEFLIDAGLSDEATDLLRDIRRRAGDLPILARYESLIASG
ncbi:MAG: tetratricopeptide repeat protein [Deltaproteobacteria bacterium]|nr:tetratricopeptide repeat protein [Deltaproteobacteria bacterium]